MEVGAEGNPIRLAERRTPSFANRKIVIGSKPLFEDTSHVLRAEALNALVYGFAARAAAPVQLGRRMDELRGIGAVAPPLPVIRSAWMRRVRGRQSTDG